MRTLRLLVAALAAGCAHGAPPAPPTPVSDTAQTARLRPPTGLVIVEPWVNYCIVRDGRLESVTADLLAGGDTVYGGRPISKAFPADSTYAANAAWYRAPEPIRVLGKPYVKHGTEIVLGTTDVVPVATFRGVTVFVEPSANLRSPDVIYVPVRPGCEFQPYAHPETLGRLRPD